MTRKLLLALLLLLPFSGNVYAQLLAIPPHASVYTSSVRGYWFTAPCNFTITGLKVSPEAGTGTQYIHVMKINDAVPVLFSASSTNFTTLTYISNATNNVVQTVNIPVNAGDIIGILGCVGTTTANSYSAAVTPYATTLNSLPVTLNRLIYQGTLLSGPAPNYSTEATGAISRVEMYYSVVPPAPPSCVAAPITPTNGATGICSGNTLLKWNKVNTAASYDVYLNSGAGNPTTVVSANQVDTFFNATSFVGINTWKVVPKNATGAATGCGNFTFTTIQGTTPTATLSVTPNDTICITIPAVFSVAVTSGGTAPVYQWKKNNVNVGTNSPTYTDNAVANNDNYKVVVTSNSTGCLTSNPVTSDVIKMTLLPTPVTTVTAAGPTAFCMGGSVQLNGQAGATTYQWLNNSAPIAGATSSSFAAMYSGYYKVKTTGFGNGCPSISDSIKVTVYHTPFPHVNRNANTLTTETYYASYQWYRGNYLIPGATASSYTFANDGPYYVKVTDTAGCTGSSVYVPVNNLAVNNINGSDVKIYPNPANDVLFVDAPAKVNATIRSLDGKLVLYKENVSKLDISSIAAGVYSISITDKDKQVVSVQKLVKTVQ